MIDAYIIWCIALISLVIGIAIGYFFTGDHVVQRNIHANGNVVGGGCCNHDIKPKPPIDKSYKYNWKDHV